MLKQMTKETTLYKGLGFVEALLAILVTGMASVALMDIASRTMTDTIRNEMTDTMTQYAVEGVEMVQIIADEQRLTGGDLFPDPLLSSNTCFLMNEDVEDPYFVKEEDVFKTYTYLERETFKELAKLEADDQYFRIFCIQEGDAQLVVGKIVVGLVNRTSTVENNSLVFKTGGITNVSDYEHYTVIKL